MAFLSLAQGDPVGRDLLKKLVAARYGQSPPALDTLRIQYTGRSKTRLGPFPLWARLEATATYRFPLEMKWTFNITVLRFIHTKFTMSYDGQQVYHQRGLTVEVEQDPVAIQSERRRAWSETVFFVSPLIANPDVRVTGHEEHAFTTVLKDYPDDVVTVRMNEDNVLREIEVTRRDPEDQLIKQQFIRCVGDLERVDNLILPSHIQRVWADEVIMELTPVAAELNPTLPADAFTLKGEDIKQVLRELDEEDTAAGTQAAE